MSNIPIMYSSHDVGAPQVKDVAVNGRLAQSLKNILVPALVTGYGDKPAAGWKLVHEHEFGFVLSNGDGTFFVNFVSNLPAISPFPAINSYNIHVYAASSFSGSDGAKMEGANLCSGWFRDGIPEPSGRKRHSLGGGSHYALWQNRATSNWSIVADKHSFIFNVSSSSADNSPDSQSVSVYAGQVKTNIVDNYDVVIGGVHENDYGSLQYGYGLGNGFSSPINPINGLSETTLVTAHPDNRLLYKNNDNINFQQRNCMNLIQPMLMVSNVWVGNLRGVVNDPFLAGYSSWIGFLSQVGLEPEFTNRNKPIEIDGHLYCYARHPSCGGMYMTTNPEFW